MACVYGLYLMYPTLTTASFSLLRCVPVPDGEDGETILYLIADQQVECYTGMHLEWVVFLTIPCFALFVVGLPLTGVLILHLNRKALYDRTHSNHRWIMVKYGLLFDGYKKDAWWFELVVALRKAGFVALAIMTEGQIQVQLAIGFLAFMVAMNVMIEPYGIGMGALAENKRLTNLDAGSSGGSSSGSNSRAASRRKMKRQNSHLQNKYDHTVLHRMDLVALLTSLVLAWAGMLFILAKNQRQGSTEHTIEEEILGLVVLALNIGLLLWAMYAFFTRWVHEHERHFKSVARLAKKVRTRVSTSRRGSAPEVKAAQSVFKRSTLNPLSMAAGAELPPISAEIEMTSGAKSNAKTGAKSRGGHHSREKSLGKLKEATVITLAAAFDPTKGEKKLKKKGRQHLSDKNKDHVGIAVGRAAEDTGFKSGEADIFVKVSDYSTNPNAHRDPLTGQWYVFDPITEKCKWIVEDKDADKMHAHSNKLRANLNKTLAGAGNLKRVQSLYRLRQKGDIAVKDQKKKGRQYQSSPVSEDVHFMPGEAKIFDLHANQEGEEAEKTKKKPHPNAHFDEVSGHWYLFDANTGVSQWLLEEDTGNMTENPISDFGKN